MTYVQVVRTGSQRPEVRTRLWSHTPACVILGLITQPPWALESQGYEPEIRGFCWMQGETDACYEDHNAAYGGRYDALLKDFVAAFPTYTETCVFADAGVSTTWPYHPQMNAFKAEYAATHPRCAYIDTIGKGMTTATEPEGNVDIYHYDCGSTVELGRYFIQALGL